MCSYVNKFSKKSIYLILLLRRSTYILLIFSLRWNDIIKQIGPKRMLIWLLYLRKRGGGSLTDCDRGHFTCILLISNILLHMKSDILIFYENTTTSSRADYECDLQTRPGTRNIKRKFHYFSISHQTMNLSYNFLYFFAISWSSNLFSMYIYFIKTWWIL